MIICILILQQRIIEINNRMNKNVMLYRKNICYKLNIKHFNPKSKHIYQINLDNCKSIENRYDGMDIEPVQLLKGC